MQQRTITVNGVGKASARPDRICIPITLTASNMHYEKAMALAAQKHEALKLALSKENIAEGEIKTTDFRVDATYENDQKENGSYVRRFTGYACTHSVLIRFDLDMDRLGRVLDCIAASATAPEFHIRFDLKDPEPLLNEALQDAASVARKRAEVLAFAAGASLGELLDVHYALTDARIESKTNLASVLPMAAAYSRSIEFQPEDVDISESVTFVWTLEPCART